MQWAAFEVSASSEKVEEIIKKEIKKRLSGQAKD